MKYKTTFILISLILSSCSKPTIFVLQDKDEDIRYYVSDSVKIAFRNEAVNKTPLIAIDGVVLEYDKKADTVKLPLKKSDIGFMSILHKNSSSVIYGPEAVNGAIIINTVNLNRTTSR